MSIRWKEWYKSMFVWTIVLLLAKMALFRILVYDKLTLDKILIDAFDVVVIACLIELFRPGRVKTALFWIFNLLVSLALLASAIYFQNFGTVPIYTTLKQLHQVGQVSSSVRSIMRPEDLLFFADILIVLLFKLVVRKKPKRNYVPFRLPSPVTYALMIVSVLLASSSIAAASGTKNELKKGEELGFFAYQAVSLFDGLRANRTNYADISEVKQNLTELEASFPRSAPLAPGAAPNYFGTEKGKNVIVVQLEAFQNFPINLEVNGQAITPNMNELLKSSFYFNNFFQQVGQGNTSDAEFISNTSIYPTATVAMSSGFNNRELPGLPRALNALQYETNTFHVNDVKFWDRDKMYPALGFKQYFDKPSFTNDNFNAFGASDEELYKTGMKRLVELKNENQPFYAQFISASSHHPFKIPADKQTLDLPENIKGKQLGDYLEAVHYTDYALGTLINQLKENGMWDNTVLVLYGDHFGLQPQDNDPKMVSEALGIDYHEQISRYNIPLIIHAPSQKEGKQIETAGGQLDIMPTVANLLGIRLDETGIVPFGHDLLNVTKNVSGIRYYLPTGSFVNNDILFVPGEGFDDGTAVSLKTHKPVADFSQYRKDYDYIMDLMQLSDEYVKLLPVRK
ncbi:sulfatase [Paenibacillus chitinolyticus]|uniref:LTA synthase family protein n=1 Tax=Paenibacillus chitinolyticus TaxID=79263 RepID=A0A410WWK4_9BACL|nr:LTA synthase family protein [Paenibacillus chitinolyticus]MCY9593852.1 LTA synthase family protein [Paenibacillus chitinolyticus]MCY9597670.1 LTA synthase family protein [Paenibacillus chitinolyticus]QAV18657.1 sulfatase [Paenibacillus chitinolyticus]